MGLISIYGSPRGCMYRPTTLSSGDILRLRNVTKHAFSASTNSPCSPVRHLNQLFICIENYTYMHCALNISRNRQCSTPVNTAHQAPLLCLLHGKPKCENPCTEGAAALLLEYQSSTAMPVCVHGGGEGVTCTVLPNRRDYHHSRVSRGTELCADQALF